MPKVPSPTVCRARRRVLGISQREIAQMLGVAPWWVSYWERGILPVKPSTRARYAQLARAYAALLAEREEQQKAMRKQEVTSWT